MSAVYCAAAEEDEISGLTRFSTQVYLNVSLDGFENTADQREAEEGVPCRVGDVRVGVERLDLETASLEHVRQLVHVVNLHVQ